MRSNFQRAAAFAVFALLGLQGVLALSKRGIGMAWMAWLPVAVCLFLAWFPTHLMTGIDPAGLGGNTVVTLIFVYMTARLLALTIDQLPVKRLLTFGLMAYPIGLILVNLLEVVHGCFCWGICGCGFFGGIVAGTEAERQRHGGDEEECFHAVLFR